MKKLGVKNPNIKLIENKKSIVSKDGWRIEELKKLPSSKTSDIKQIKGDVNLAKEFFYNNIKPDTVKVNKNGSLIGTYRFDETATVTFRKKSTLGNRVPTIDIHGKGIKGFRKLKFIEEGVDIEK